MTDFSDKYSEARAAKQEQTYGMTGSAALIESVIAGNKPKPVKPITPIPSAQPQSELKQGSEEPIENDPENKPSALETGLNTLAFVTRPLAALSDFALAPMAHDYQSETALGQLAESLKVGGKAAWDALFPEYGEVPEFGKEVVNKYAPKIPDGIIKESLALTLEVLADPTIAIGMPARKIVHEGMRASRFKRIAAGAEPEGGLFTRGVRSIAGFDALPEEDIEKAMKLAVKADSGKAEAVNAFNKFMEDPRIANIMGDISATQNKMAADNIRTQIDPIPVSSGPVKMAAEVPDEIGKASIVTNADTRNTIINMRHMDTEERTKQVLNTMMNQYADDFNKLRESQKLSDTLFDDISQQTLLTDIMGRPAGPLPAPQAYALRMTLAAAARNVVRLSKAYQSNPNSWIAKRGVERAKAFLKIVMDQTIERQYQAGEGLRVWGLPVDGEDTGLIKQTMKLMDQEVNKMADSDAMIQAYSVIGEPKGIVRFINRVDEAVKKFTHIKSWNQLEEEFLFKVYINSILSGPVTHARNIGSTAVMTLLQPAEELAAVIPSLFRFAPKAALQHADAAKKMAIVGIQAMGDAFKIATKFNKYALETQKAGRYQKFTKHQYPAALFARNKNMATEMLESHGSQAYAADYLNTLFPEAHAPSAVNVAGQKSTRYPAKVINNLPKSKVSQVVYHGTTKGVESAKGLAPEGIRFFATDKKLASTYAEDTGKTFPAILDIQNPASHEDVLQSAIDLGHTKPDEGYTTYDMLYQMPGVVEELKQKGFDGVYNELDYGLGDATDITGPSWAVFSPDQIHLVDDTDVDDMNAVFEAYKTGIMDDKDLKHHFNKRRGQGDEFVVPKGTHVTTWQPADLLQREDFFFKVINYRMGLAREALNDAERSMFPGKVRKELYEEALNNPNEIWETSRVTAVEQAEYATFQQELGKHGKAISGTVQRYPVLRWMFPFIRTPINLVKTGAERTPFGIFKAMNDSLNPPKYLPAAEAAQRADLAWARMGLGTAMAASVLAAVDLEKLTGTVETGTPKGYFDNQLGKPEYSLKIGDTWYGYGHLEPLRFILGGVANYKEIAENVDLSTKAGGDLVDTAASTFSAAFFETALDDNYVTSLNNIVGFLRDISDGDIAAMHESDLDAGINEERPGALTKFRQKTGASLMVPNLLTQLNKSIEWLDPQFRMTNGFWDEVRARTPMLSKTLPPHRDLFGDPSFTRPGLGPDLMSPIPARKDYTDDPVIGELVRLKLDIPRAGNVIRKVRLDHTQYSELMRIAGKGIPNQIPSMKETIAGIISEEFYQRATDIGKSNMIKGVIRAQRRAATAFLINNDPSLQEKIEAMAAIEADQYTSTQTTESTSQQIPSTPPGLGQVTRRVGSQLLGR